MRASHIDIQKPIPGEFCYNSRAASQQEVRVVLILLNIMFWKFTQCFCHVERQREVMAQQTVINKVQNVR